MFSPERFSELIEASGLTRSELARRTGHWPAFISDLESGRRRPSTQAALALAQELGVSVEDFLGQDDDHVGPLAHKPDSVMATPAEAAAFLRCSPTTVYTLIKEKRLPHIRYGRRKIVVPWTALRAWADEELRKSVSA